MTDVGEQIAALTLKLDEDETCELDVPQQGWTCELDGDPTRLRRRLKEMVPEPHPCTCEDDLSLECWPFQTHHLIPWQALKSHPVTQWLTLKPEKAAAVLRADNSYSVDHWRNGKFMPYASDLPEWKATTSTAALLKLRRAVMAAAQMQLHQGRHTSTKYAAGETGYHVRVKTYLQAITENSLTHDKSGCKICADKADATKRLPRRNIVRFVDKASERLEVDINTGKIYVSRHAAEAAAAGIGMG